MATNLTNIQELELLSALETRSVTPLKFAYLGDGYKRWSAIMEKSLRDRSVHYEEELLKKESLPFIFREINQGVEAVNVIDFGCGNGIPMLSVFSYLQTKNIPTLRYIPVDISAKMLGQAQRRMKPILKNVEVIPILFDFEKGEILEEIMKTTKRRNARNYLFLLGNTLGNFDSPEKVLSNLKLSMFTDDALVIGNEISNLVATQKTLEYYHSKEVYSHTTSTLRSYGMRCRTKEFDVRWNAMERQVEMFLALEKGRRITIAGHTVQFEKGEEILLAVSKKFAEEELVETLNRVGFRLDLFTTNDKKNNCIVSITPTRYRSA